MTGPEKTSLIASYSFLFWVAILRISDNFFVLCNSLLHSNEGGYNNCILVWSFGFLASSLPTLEGYLVAYVYKGVGA